MKSDIGKMSMGISTQGTRCKYCKRDGEYSCVDCKKGRRDAFIVDKDKSFVDVVSRKTRAGNVDISLNCVHSYKILLRRQRKTIKTLQGSRKSTTFAL